MTKQELYETGKRFLSFTHWRNRLIFWCGAIVIGLIAAGFAYIADYAQKTFAGLVAFDRFLPLIICPLILGIAGWLTFVFAPSSTGSGIPQAIAALASQDSKERRNLLGPKVIFGKILFTTLGLLGGASIGREGPTVQVGAAILYLGASVANMSEEMSRSLILAGSAAGVAAAFNTPLAGIVFAIEEMARAYEHRYSGVVLTAIVLAGASSLSLLGNYNYFGAAIGGFSLNRDWLAIAILGVVGGILGASFALLLSKGISWISAQDKSAPLLKPVLFAAACGLIIAVLGLLTDGATYGSGYEQGKAFLHNGTAGSWGYTIAKFVATIASGYTGIPGGIFSPSLSIGAGFGASMASWFPSTPVSGMVLLGMTAYFAGVTQAPITAFVIVLEISGRQSMPVPLIAASIIAAAVSRMICPVSLYHALAKNFVAKVKEIHSGQNQETV